MRIRALVLTICIAMLCGCSQKNVPQRLSAYDHITGKGQSSAREDGLHGRVHTVRTEQASYVIKGGRAVLQPRWLSDIDSFTRDGKRCELSSFSGDGSWDMRLVFRRRADGKCIGIETYSKGKLREKKVMRLDSKGRARETLCYEGSSKLSSRQVCSFDHAGNATLISMYTPDGSLSGTIIQAFDARGNTTEQIFHDPKGKVASRTAILYENGNPTDIRAYDDHGRLLFRDIAVYFSKSHGYRQTRYNASGKVRGKSLFRYDSRWNPTEQASFSSKGAVIQRKLMTYNARGDIASETQYGAKDRFESKSGFTGYEYDAKGNWTKRVRLRPVSKDSKARLSPAEVEYREITYHKS